MYIPPTSSYLFMPTWALYNKPWRWTNKALDCFPLYSSKSSHTKKKAYALGLIPDVNSSPHIHIKPVRYIYMVMRLDFCNLALSTSSLDLLWYFFVSLHATQSTSPAGRPRICHAQRILEAYISNRYRSHTQTLNFHPPPRRHCWWVGT